MQHDIPQGHGKGHWQRVILGEMSDEPVWSAVLWCPECGKGMSLQRGHTIAADGQVSPSVGHPNGYPPCGWHTLPRLVGWEVRPNPPPREWNTCARCQRKSRSIGGWGTDGRVAGIICDTCRAELNAAPEEKSK